ncbi:MAG: hypothetical protein GXY91_10320 [Clostridia bacterium]|nr:hypothetical protein [Clostridia bacterium]
MSEKTKNLTYTALMIALVFVATFSVRIPVPFTQGYIHAGDSMIFVAAILFGWKMGALAGGVGSALADLLGGYANWVLPTLVIKTVMGGLVGWVAEEKNNKTKSTVISIIMAVIWFGFSFFTRSIIGKYINPGSTELISEIDGVTNIQELLSLSEKLQTQLLWISILIPVIIIGLAFYFNKIDKNLFGVDKLLGMFIAGLWMVLGYYLAAGFMYGTFIVPVFSIPWNIVQFVIGLVIAYLVIFALKRTPIIKS